MKSLLKNNLIILSLIVLLGIGCRKDATISDNVSIIDDGCPEDSCYEFPQEPELGFYFTSSGAQYITPCFNPNNENEFIYLRQGTAPNAELLKYDLLSHQDQLLCGSVSIATQPQWGRQGWIVFSTTDWKVWKIRDDGTELTQLSYGENDQLPIFNYGGNEITYARLKNYSNAELSANPSLYNEYKMIVIDLGGILLDSVVAPNVLPGNYFQKWELADSDLNGLTYFVGGSGTSAGFYILNENLDSIYPNTVASLYPNTGWVRDLTYLNGFIYYSKWRNGLYKTNVETGIEYQIKNGCDTRYYDHISVSPNGNKILVEKVLSDVLDGGEVIDERHEIWSISLDSCYQEKILGQ